MLESDKEHANDVLSRFLIAAVESHDSAAVASAIKVATSRGWPLQKLSSAAVEKVAVAVMKRDLALATSEETRPFWSFLRASFSRSSFARRQRRPLERSHAVIANSGA